MHASRQDGRCDTTHTKTTLADRALTEASPFRRFVALIRALAGTAGRAALRRSFPTYIVMAMAAGMVFGGNGLAPATVVEAAQDSLAVRAVLWSGWLVFTMPAARAVLEARSAFWLRSLPIPRWHFVVIQGAFMVLVELPWVLLWMWGGGVVLGLGVALAAVSAHGMLVARSLRPIGVMAAVVTGLVILVPAPPWLMLASMPLVSVAALRLAWVRAPEFGPPLVRAIVGGPPVLAVASAYVATLLRGHRMLVIRALVFVGLSTALGVLAIRNGGVADAAGHTIYAVAFLVPAIVGATASFAGPVLRSEAAAAWAFRVSGTSRWMRWAGGALAAALMAGVLGGLHGAFVLVFADTARIDPPRLVIACVVTAAALSTASFTIVRRTRTSGRMVLLLIGLTVVAILMNLALGPWSLLILVPAAAVAGMRRRSQAGRYPEEADTMSTARENVMLDVRGVHKRLGGRQILEDVTFACRPSELVMVLGHNGAGKSTLLRVLAGVLEPDRGEVLVDGASMARGGVQARKSLGYAPNASGSTGATDPFPQLMVSEFVGLTRILKGLPSRLDDAALRSQLEVDAIWNQRLGTLSFGERKRVYILSAALGDPKVLILDEPSNGLDQRGTQVVVSLLESRSAQALTTICATNDPALMLSLPATRLRIEDGRLAAEPD